MKKRIVISLLILVGLPLLAGALWVLKPWSSYSPLAIQRLFNEKTRIENFRQMERFLPHQVVNAPDKPYVFPRAERPLSVTYEYQGKTHTLEDFLERATGTGLVIIQNGTIINERYLLGETETTRHTSWSVAKSFVATLVGIALKDGLIQSLDDSIDQYTPVLRDTAYKGIPIRHVLQMASGVKFSEKYDSFSDVQMFYVKVLGLNRSVGNIMKDYATEQPSGQKFNYKGVDTLALGLLVEAVYKKGLTQVLEEKIWKPLGMEAAAYWNTDVQGDQSTPISFCCLNATLRDYAKLGQLYLQDGVWQGTRILPEGWVKLATTPGGDFLEPRALPYNGVRGYQFQWWVPANYEREYFASGVWGQYVYVSEPDQLVIARTSVDPNFTKNLPETIVVFRAIRDALRNPSIAKDAPVALIGAPH